MLTKKALLVVFCSLVFLICPLLYGQATGSFAGTVTDKSGSVVAGASVKATVLAHGRGDKVTIFKMRRRKHYQKHQGHRQGYTELKIDGIVG